MLTLQGNVWKDRADAGRQRGRKITDPINAAVQEPHSDLAAGRRLVMKSAMRVAAGGSMFASTATT